MLPCYHPADGRGGTPHPWMPQEQGLCVPHAPSPWSCPGPSMAASPVGCSESAGVCAPSCPRGAPSLSGASGLQQPPCQCCHPSDECSGLCWDFALSANTACARASMGPRFACQPIFHRLSQTLRTKRVHMHVHAHVCAHVCARVCACTAAPPWPGRTCCRHNRELTASPTLCLYLGWAPSPARSATGACPVPPAPAAAPCQHRAGAGASRRTAPPPPCHVRSAARRVPGARGFVPGQRGCTNPPEPIQLQRLAANLS